MKEPLDYTELLGLYGGYECAPPIVWATVDLVLPDGTLIERGTYVLQEDGSYDYTPELL